MMATPCKRLLKNDEFCWLEGNGKGVLRLSVNKGKQAGFSSPKCGHLLTLGLIMRHEACTASCGGNSFTHLYFFVGREWAKLDIHRHTSGCHVEWKTHSGLEYEKITWPGR